MTALRQRQPREKDPGHLKRIRALPCICCGAGNVDAAHVRMTGPDKWNAGVGQKPHDCYVLPLCRECHQEQHHLGEKRFWGDLGIDPIVVSRQLYRLSHDHDAMYSLVWVLQRANEKTLEIPF